MPTARRRKVTGIDLIRAERRRQVTDEKWTSKHDDYHIKEELARAAACYALPKNVRETMVLQRNLLSYLWPWEGRWWKPGRGTAKDGGREARIRDLTKAGALCAAEIDRLIRLRDSGPPNEADIARGEELAREHGW